VASAGRIVSENSGEFNPIQVDSSEFNQNENKKSEAHGNSRKSMIIPVNSPFLGLEFARRADTSC
jgi:hypothetical protein